MDIEKNDFRYMAAFHCAKGHPHIHLMYWDNSDKVRPEFVQHDKFEIIAEKIRSQFSREVFRAEIFGEKTVQKESSNAMKTELLALFKELNPEEPIDVNRISKPDYAVVSDSFNNVIKTMPPVPSFRYEYLDRATKKSLQNLLDTVFKIPQFSANLQQYMKATEEISKLYSNGKEQIEYQLKRGKREVYSALGNAALKFIKENNIRYCPNQDAVKCSFMSLQEKLRKAIKNDIKTCDLYKDALSAFPPVRTPMKVFADKNFRHTVFLLVKETLKYDEVWGAMQDYISSSVKYSVFSEEMRKITEEVMKYENVDLKEYANKLGKEQYRDIFKETYRHILSQLYNDAGYEKQYLSDCVQNLLMNLFGSVSQSTNHVKASLKLHRERRGKEEMSKDARNDISEERSQSENNWER